MNQPKQIQIYDTTLRDGNQALGISLSVSDKLRIAARLSDLGIHYIEGGWPNATNNADVDFFKRVKKLGLASKIAAFGSTRRPRHTCTSDPYVQMLLKSGAPVVTVFGKSWDLHATKVLKVTLEQNLELIHDTVSYLSRRVDEVIYDAEHFFDGYRHNKDYALETLAAAQDAGAGVIVLCDTNGGTLPDEFVDTWRAAKRAVRCGLGVHTHNDAGCADANSLLAVSEGAVQVQGTMNGLGERCGNANLCTVIPDLQLKRGCAVLAPQALQKLTEASVFVSEVANEAHNMRQPYVGECAFTHKAGAHADGVRKAEESFEHVKPQSVGNTRQFVVSSQAGQSTILQKLSQARPGLGKHHPVVKKLLAKIKALEGDGYQFEAADASFELIAQEMLGRIAETFEFKGFRVIEEKRESGDVFSEATIKLKKDGVYEHTAAEGDGPVNALDNALRKALVKFYPNLREVKLEDFKVRVLDGKEGTAAKVRVLIESSDGRDRWGTVGVSTNVIEASWLALIDSLKYKLMKDGLAEADGKIRKDDRPRKRQK
ncbi:MAG TPA: citramalate synthase [Chitinivibrionales bacterium]|nr:citramalate synthase [Chitinivibrionales bacterium]